MGSEPTVPSADAPDEPSRASSLIAADGVPLVVRRAGSRRVTTDAVPGSDPTPTPVPRGEDSAENDARLRQDVPPHWG